MFDFLQSIPISLKLYNNYKYITNKHKFVEILTSTIFSLVANRRTLKTNVYWDNSRLQSKMLIIVWK